MQLVETITRLMAQRCENCPLCQYARKNPESLVGMAVAFHGKFCPFWQAREKIYGQKAETSGR